MVATILITDTNSHAQLVMGLHRERVMGVYTSKLRLTSNSLSHTLTNPMKGCLPVE